ncbi:hypothetical protein GCM10009682_53750 [Luedemannella flava]|uniref:LURP-one-related family protein n=1 Tax=Luedemannella flava TaxID=349316 RepID=A0ABP4YXT9_9ACTN
MYLIKERFFRLGNDSEITDEGGRTVFDVDGKVLSLRDRLVIKDPDGTPVAEVRRRLLALRPSYVVTIGGEKAAVVRKRWLRLFRDRYLIDVPGPHDLTMKGSLLDHEFTIRRDGDTVATVSKRWVSIRDTYAVDIAESENHLLILGVALALDLAEERAEKTDS